MNSELTDEGEIEKIIQEYAEKIGKREEYLEGKVKEILGLEEILKRPIEDLKSGRKSSRVIPALVAFERYSGEIPESLKRTLIGFDIYIDALDDVVDTKNTDKLKRVEQTARMSHSLPLIIGGLGNLNLNKVNDGLAQYLTNLFQIPGVEKDSIEKIKKSNSHEEKIKHSKYCYDFRSKVMDGFGIIPATYFELNPKETNNILNDLRTYRARHLLFKDIEDAERDIEDEDTKPILEITKEDPNPEKTIEKLYNSFGYSPQSEETYKKDLIKLEGKPKNLDEEIEKAINTYRALKVV